MSGTARAQWARADFPGDPWDQAIKILIVEDVPKTGDYLEQGLTEIGLRIAWTRRWR